MSDSRPDDVPAGGLAAVLPTPLPLPSTRAFDPASPPPPRATPRRPTLLFMLAHPAHWIAFGFGAGLSPKAPGTIGTLWAWLSFAALAPWLGGVGWATVLGLGTLVGWWASTVAARHLNHADPRPIVVDEILAFWLVLWMIGPAGFVAQAVAFGLFRYFDAAKPGPVGWADGCFKRRQGRPIGAWEGFGVLFDDFVAALCVLLVMAAWRFFA